MIAVGEVVLPRRALIQRLVGEQPNCRSHRHALEYALEQINTNSIRKLLPAFRRSAG